MSRSNEALRMAPRMPQNMQLETQKLKKISGGAMAPRMHLNMQLETQNLKKKYCGGAHPQTPPSVGREYPSPYLHYRSFGAQPPPPPNPSPGGWIRTDAPRT